MLSEIENNDGEGSDAQSQPGFGRSRRWRFTLVELIVVTVIVAVGLALLVPFIQRHREMQRRTRCLNNMHQLGLATQNYASTYANTFPPAAGVYGTSAKKTIGGYSFLVKLLPFMEFGYHYGEIQMAPLGPNGEIPESNDYFIKRASECLPQYVCPSNTNSKFQSPTGSPPHFAFTNYKAVGATTRDSLLMAANVTGKPPYGTASQHPDGMIYPANNNLPLAALTDGTSHTILLMETIDDQHSRWTVGAECTLIGMPQACGNVTKGRNGGFYAQPEFDGTFGDDSGVTRAGLRTFLMYDFSPGGADAGKYEDPGWAKAPPAYGPSSMHPGVVVVSMCDGSAIALNKRCDAANLFFLITKNGQDPFNLP